MKHKLTITWESDSKIENGAIYLPTDDSYVKAYLEEVRHGATVLVTDLVDRQVKSVEIELSSEK